VRGGALGLSLLLAVAALTPSTASADPRPVSSESRGAPQIANLDALLGACAKMPGLAAKFSEEKQIALLAVPLRSGGTLHYTRARGLVRHTAEPSKQSVLVTDKDLVFWDGKDTKRVSLGSSATLETFARAFSLLLAADRPALEKSFALSFRAEDASDGWSLKLTPKGAALHDVIKGIEIEGHGLTLSMLRVREANGDVSTTRFFAVDTNKRYSDEEANRTFRVPPA